MDVRWQVSAAVKKIPPDWEDTAVTETLLLADERS
jgi:hypothetical protein